MDILIYAIIILIVCALVVYAIGYLGLPSPFDKLIIALVIIVGAYAIATRAGII